ncbi:hypothetical protein [Immundisolibacter sp.]|uniref:hypothetical protein n=1 Tax=Immundisolibacter sp. TaxID=1934948 RepID=UPI00261FAD31|nr:hypothetical protein [Immundisolibacter sp.]MDD3651818.1 hypothetical protein [Immundisolibacter sp.]
MRRTRICSQTLSLALGTTAALAGPPFMTDDPEPVEYRHSEAYVFSTYDRGPQGDKSFAAPAFEFNTSPAPDWHLHAMLPFTGVRPGDGPDEYGLGDVELGVKYRFLHETDNRPQAGVFPMFYVPTGDADKGLGNDRVWGTFPLWLQKSFGPWTTYGGGGRAFNSAPGMRNYSFGGWLLQREVTDRLTLGGELFYQGAPSDDARHATFFNVGGVYSDVAACGGCSLLFRVGSTVAGESHDGGYLGLYWNFGPSGGGPTSAAPFLQPSQTQR